jgi:hypothetical protein
MIAVQSTGGSPSTAPRLMTSMAKALSGGGVTTVQFYLPQTISSSTSRRFEVTGVTVDSPNEGLCVDLLAGWNDPGLELVSQ